MKVLIEFCQELEEKFPGVDFTPYFTFIESKPVLKKGGHRHHILPTKEFPDLRKDFNNRIRLTPGDHLRAHYWLALCVPECDSFQLSFYLMANYKVEKICENELAKFAEIYEKGRNKQKEQATKLGKSNVDSGFLNSIRTREGCVRGGRQGGPIGGRISGQKSVENGWIQALGKSGIGGRIGGKTQGRRNVENGHLAQICTPEVCAKGGRIGGQKNVESGQWASVLGRGNHIRWHVNLGIVKPNCKLCEGRAV